MSDNQFQVMNEFSYVAKLQIDIHPEDLERIHLTNYLYVKVESENGQIVTCMLMANSNVEKGRAKISKRCFGKIGFNTYVTIQPQPFQFVKRGIPKVENINKPFVLASEELVDEFSNNVELINITNGYRMKVKLQKATHTADCDKVFLNRYHLLLLELNGDIQKKLIITRAEEDTKKKIVKKLLLGAKSFYFKLTRKIGDLFIGYRELDLRVGYNYPFDETRTVTRMHPNIRKFLGVEENDRLIISYNQKSKKLPVLDLDPENVNEVIKIEDDKTKFIDSHLYIGIPATTRNQLGIPNIGSVIKVRRSMKFILLKHINKLILPLIALWFSIFSIIKANSYQNIIKIILLIIIISPIVIFASLSEERAKVK
ncbi:hypothetical protein [Niallia sp. Krafla_26]|uniref:hypothetical protein n=1 Tax=Niallia sp. Krafla_26 TaxID=3064703 RepID=UPI003D174235